MMITSEQMLKIEENGHKMGFLKKLMMENAGSSTAKIIVQKFHDVHLKKILIFAGLGNNGGDAFVVARHLSGYGADISIILLGENTQIKTEESKSNWLLLNKMKSSIKIIHNNSYLNLMPDIIIDGIFGTGISGNIREPHYSAINFINNSHAFIISVDIPSGLDPNTGNTYNICVKPAITVTFHKLKTGMNNKDNLCGKIYVEKIGIPLEAETDVL